MSIIYDATIEPSKLDMLAAWLPSQEWFIPVPDAELERVASFRFDDPAGQVGMETLLIRHGAWMYQVPLVYRNAPVPELAAFLLTSTEHSVLGTRWVYDATGDPLYVAAIAGAVLAAEPQANQVEHRGEERIPLPATITLTSTGTPGTPVPAVESVTAHTVGGVTTIRSGGLSIAVVRSLADDDGTHLGAALTGAWAGGPAAALLATASLTDPS